MKKVFRRLAAGVKNAAKRINTKVILAIGATMSVAGKVMAQTSWGDLGAGQDALTEAQDELATYVDPVGNIVMIIGGIVGLIGAIRVYSKWQNGDQDVTKSLMGWVGSSLFLVIAGYLIKQLFGVGS